MMVDIAILGLGPAGATLARLLDSRFSVLALDKKASSGTSGFHKPCGGLLAPDAQEAIARFNLTLPLETLVHPQLFSVRTIDLRTNLTRDYQRFYLNLDRHRFDQWLLSLIPPGIDYRPAARVTAITRTEGGFEIEWMESGKRRTARAKRIVGADGANSLVRRSLFPAAALRTYLSIQQWFDDFHPSPFYACIFDPALTDSYAWGLSKNGSFIFGGAFAPRGARQAFETLKRKLIPHGFNLENPLRTEACQVLRPNGLFDVCTGGGNAFLCGEAAGFISPSSLEGISHAFNSADRLARVLNADGSAGDYQRATLPLRLRLFGKTIKSPFMYQPQLREAVMRSRIGTL